MPGGRPSWWRAVQTLMESARPSPSMAFEMPFWRYPCTCLLSRVWSTGLGITGEDLRGL